MRRKAEKFALNVPDVPIVWSSYKTTDRVREQLDRTHNWVFLGKLAAGLVHEINNPLDGVINCIRQLKSGRLSPEQQQKYFDLAEAELFRIESLSRRLLGLAREQQIAPEPTDINELIEKAWFFVDYRMSRKHITLRRHLARRLPRISVDPGGITQVLVNLFLNAGESMTNGGVLTVKSSVDRTWLNIAVTDTGVGIPKENLRRIFLPFFTTREEQGAGLGLAICLSIVEQHGGRIEVESAANRGTTFTVRLPVR